MDLDLEPHEYGERGRKEPILAKGWWIGVIAIAIVFALAFAKFSLLKWLSGGH